jgi:hypothetical protein
LRRYGPIAAILVVVALIVAASTVMGGDDDDDTASNTTESPLAQGLPEGAVSWSMAKAQGLDVTFPDTCDKSSGYVAIPFFFRTECFANLEGSNGGATHMGVTENEIKVVVWLPNDNDPIFAFLKQALGFDDSIEEMKQTQIGLAEIFQTYYQTYGRTVKLEFLQASGPLFDTVAARADAVKAAEMEPFAVLGGPLLANTWTEELHARHVPCIACPGIKDPAPDAFGLIPSDEQSRLHAVNYVKAKLAGKPVQFAGDELVGKDRVFGLLKLASNEGDRQDAQDLKTDMAAENIDLAAVSTFALDLGAAQENAQAAVSQMTDAGVTTVLVDADPLNLGSITAEATKQHWFPEWVMIGPPLLDTVAGASLQDPEQWKHAFGISWLPPASPPEVNPAYQLYEWFHGEPPPGESSLLLTYPQIALFFTAVELAGPTLNPDTARQAAFAYPPTPRARTQPSLNYGPEIYGDLVEDYAGIDDFVEIWWDPNAVGINELGQEQRGLYRYVDNGKRYYYNEYTDEVKVFDPENAVTSITDPAPEEIPPDYPSPAGG